MTPLEVGALIPIPAFLIHPLGSPAAMIDAETRASAG
jgi:hypothetical protein